MADGYEEAKSTHGRRHLSYAATAKYGSGADEWLTSVTARLALMPIFMLRR